MAITDPTWSYGTVKTFTDSGSRPTPDNATWSYGVLIELFEHIYTVAAGIRYQTNQSIYNFLTQNNQYNFKTKIENYNFDTERK